MNISYNLTRCAIIGTDLASLVFVAKDQRLSIWFKIASLVHKILFLIYDTGLIRETVCLLSSRKIEVIRYLAEAGLIVVSYSSYTHNPILEAFEKNLLFNNFNAIRAKFQRAIYQFQKLSTTPDWQKLLEACRQITTLFGLMQIIFKLGTLNSIFTKSTDYFSKKYSTILLADYFEKNGKTAQDQSLQQEGKECPITLTDIENPVVEISRQGNQIYTHIYEKQAVELWLNARSTSPVTRVPLSTDRLISLDELKERICIHLNTNSINKRLNVILSRCYLALYETQKKINAEFTDLRERCITNPIIRDMPLLMHFIDSMLCGAVIHTVSQIIHMFAYKIIDAIFRANGIE